MRIALLALVVVDIGCTGAIDGGTGDDTMAPGGAPVVMETEVDIEGPAVLAHVQHFANVVCGTFAKACHISTYEGHQPTAARAIDIRASDVYGELPTDNNVLGDTVAQFALDHQAEHGITYVIWRQRYNDGSGWDPMEDRGSITQNHYDHVHVSFDETP